jgi:hypothetical protein
MLHLNLQSFLGGRVAVNRQDGNQTKLSFGTIVSIGDDCTVHVLFDDVFTGRYVVTDLAPHLKLYNENADKDVFRAPSKNLVKAFQECSDFTNENQVFRLWALSNLAKQPPVGTTLQHFKELEIVFFGEDDTPIVGKVFEARVQPTLKLNASFSYDQLLFVVKVPKDKQMGTIDWDEFIDFRTNFLHYTPTPVTDPGTASTNGASCKDERKVRSTEQNAEAEDVSQATGATMAAAIANNQQASQASTAAATNIHQGNHQGDQEPSQASTTAVTTSNHDQVKELQKQLDEKKKELIKIKKEATTAKNKVKQLNDQVTQVAQASTERRRSSTASSARSSRSRSRNRTGTTNVSFADQHLRPGEVTYEITTVQSPEMYATFWIVADNPSDGYELTSKDAKYAICKKCGDQVAFRFRQPSSLQRHYRGCKATERGQRVEQRQRKRQQQQSPINLNVSSHHHQQQQQEQQQMQQHPPTVLNPPLQPQQQQPPPTPMPPPRQQQLPQQQQQRTYTLDEIESLSKILKMEKASESQDPTPQLAVSHETLASVPPSLLMAPQPVFSAATGPVQPLTPQAPAIQQVPSQYFESLARQYYQEAEPFHHREQRPYYQHLPQRPHQYQQQPQGLPPQYQQPPQHPPPQHPPHHQYHPPAGYPPNPNGGYYPGY